MLDYQRRYLAALSRNVAQVQAMVISGRIDDALSTKVDRYCDKFGFSRDEVLELIASQPMFAATFAKDPVKQNLHESSAAAYISGMVPLVERFENLPAGGANAVQLSADGVVSSACRDRRDGAAVKSVDFTWVCAGVRFFALHKWTKDEGGGQDHQHAEALRFCSAASLVDGAPPRDGDAEANMVRRDGLVAARFVAICDGPYYTERRVRRDGELASRLEVMAEQFSHVPHVDVCSVNDLGALLAGFSAGRHRVAAARLRAAA